jgi:hypothetical protein
MNVFGTMLITTPAGRQRAAPEVGGESAWAIADGDSGAASTNAALTTVNRCIPPPLETSTS